MVPGSAKLQRQTDDELIERVLRGETRFFAALVERYQDPVYGMALRFVRSASDAEDLAQEAFLRAYRGLEGFKGDARFSTWLYRITWNLCTDWLRRNRKPGHPSGALDDAAGVADERVDLEEGLLAAEERHTVRQALDRLAERYRSVLILMYYQKMSYEQIASVLEVPTKTVETRLYRARKLLRRSLQRAGVRGAG
ncbi:MAG: sigma-70 family RNA polymerase sigma factor [Spirochaetia bacterium]|jgi:RNA polymerase sigma-70 factor (ECF subfamily)